MLAALERCSASSATRRAGRGAGPPGGAGQRARAQADFLAALGTLRLGPLGDLEGALSRVPRRRSSATPPHAGAHAALVCSSIGRETREGALDVLEPLAETRGDYAGAGGALRAGASSCADDRNETRAWLRRIAERGRRTAGPTRPGAGSAGTRAQGGAAAGGRARRPRADGRHRQACRRRAPRNRGGAGRRGARRRPKSWPCAPRASTRRPAIAQAAERLYLRVLDRRSPRTVTRFRRWKACTAARRRRPSWPPCSSDASTGELDPQAGGPRLLEAARLHEGQGDSPRRVAACSSSARADEEDVEALKPSWRVFTRRGPGARADRGPGGPGPPHRGRRAARRRSGRASASCGSARSTISTARPRPSARRSTGRPTTRWPSPPWRRSRSGAGTGRRCRRCCCGGWAPPGRRRSGRGPVQAGAKRRAEAVRRRSGGRVPAPAAGRRPGNGSAYLELERILRAARALVRPRRRARQARRRRGERPGEGRRSWPCGSRSPTSGRRISTRRRAPPRRWRRSWRWRPTTSPRCCRWRACTSGTSAGTRRASALERAAANAREPAEIAEIHFRNATILRSKEADPAEIEAALLRALDADSGPPPDPGGAGEDWPATPRTTSGWPTSSTSSCTRPRDDGERGRLLREIAGLYGGPLAQPAAALPYLERLVALDPTEIPGREQLAEALLSAGRTEQATRIIDRGDRRADQGAARKRDRPLADPARHDRRGARRRRRRRRPASTPPTSSTPATRRPSRRSGASPTGAATSRPPASSTARCCCRTSTTRPPASPRRRST